MLQKSLAETELRLNTGMEKAIYRREKCKIQYFTKKSSKGSKIFIKQILLQMLEEYAVLPEVNDFFPIYLD